jgi:hypothetical protein
VVETIPVSRAVRKGEGGMNGKSVWLGGLVAALLGLGVAHGQGPSYPPGETAGVPAPSPAAGPNGSAPESGPPPVPPHPGLSDWIVGPRPACCCGPVGGSGLIRAESYLRTGASFPVGGGIFSRTLDNGWDIEGGVRSLFLNKADDAAWVIDLGITNIFNPGTNNGIVVGLKDVPVTTPSIIPGGTPTTTLVPNLDVTIKNLNRTYVNLSGGREVWLLGTSESSRDQFNWRVGADFGGRWGTEKAEFNGFHHRTASLGAVFVAVHSDIEFPIGWLIFFGGIRGEFGYTWSNILTTPNNSESIDINVLATLGFRF